MKLNKLIMVAQKQLDRYKKKFPEHQNPEIFSIDEDEGILLCSKVVKKGCVRTAKKPYLYFKSGIERLL